MEEVIFSRYAHRAGCVLSGKLICDGCFHVFKDGEMAFQCMKCSGFICSDNNLRDIRPVDLAATVRASIADYESLTLSNTTPYSDY